MLVHFKTGKNVEIFKKAPAPDTFYCLQVKVKTQIEIKIKNCQPQVHSLDLSDMEENDSMGGISRRVQWTRFNWYNLCDLNESAIKV